MFGSARGTSRRRGILGSAALALALAFAVAQPAGASVVDGTGVPPAGLSVPAAGPGQMLGSGLTFNLTKGPGILALEGGTPADQQLAADVVGGFTDGAALWSAQFTDEIEINVTIDYAALASLGSASTVGARAEFLPVKNALIADAQSADDAVAVANFQPGATMDMITNDTSILAAPRIRDNDTSENNYVMDMPRANLKAIGLLDASDPAQDGAITFSSSAAWDFDRSNGIAFNKYDFVGAAAHEIGHVMGFLSDVDGVDYFAGPDGPGAPEDLSNGWHIFRALDFFRYSADSLDEPNQPANGAVLDLAVAGAPFFSIDGGVTNLGQFSTGAYNGDGRQASHWKDNQGLGIMDPTVSPGELMAISTLDLQAFDVIGYDPVPEPATAMLLAAGMAWLAARRKRRT